MLAQVTARQQHRAHFAIEQRRQQFHRLRAGAALGPVHLEQPRAIRLQRRHHRLPRRIQFAPVARLGDAVLYSVRLLAGQPPQHPVR